jgi:hypothetical protein
MYLTSPAPSRTVALPGPVWTCSPPWFVADCDATPPAVLMIGVLVEGLSAAFAASTVVAVVECLTASPVDSPSPEYSFSVESAVPEAQPMPTPSPPVQSVLA